MTPEKTIGIRESKALSLIFSTVDLHTFVFELKGHISNKKYVPSQTLTHAESVFDWISGIGSEIVSDGFVSVFNQYFAPNSFILVCEALTEVGGTKLRDLLCEAWDIYTKGKDPITIDELRSVSVRRFNTKEKMDRFDQIGEEVMAEIREQYAKGRVWSVEYAKLHRDEFEPVRQ